MKKLDVLCVGVMLTDLLLGPLSQGIFDRETTFVDHMQFTTGGDALNEGIVLARLGKKVGLIGQVGKDLFGQYIIQRCEENSIDHKGIIRSAEIATRTNVVLIKEDGQRHFIKTMPTRSQSFRKEDIAFEQLKEARAVSLASIFSSKLRDPEIIYEIVKCAKDGGAVTFADTVPFEQEAPLEYLAKALPYIDYILPNLEEAGMLTGKSTPEEMADVLLDAGVKNIAIKMGETGCFLKNQGGAFHIPGLKVKVVDTTGAGDHFTAGFIASALDGKDFAACGEYANTLAGRSTEYVGATAEDL